MASPLQKKCKIKLKPAHKTINKKPYFFPLYDIRDG